MISYKDVLDSKTKEECLERFEALLTQISDKHGGTPDSHREVQLSNIGYFSGYYDKETSLRIRKWLGAKHPIFGDGYPEFGVENCVAHGFDRASAMLDEEEE